MSNLKSIALYSSGLILYIICLYLSNGSYIVLLSEISGILMVFGLIIAKEIKVEINHESV